MSKKDKLHDSRLLQSFGPRNNTEKKDMLLQNIYSMETNLVSNKKGQNKDNQKSLENFRGIQINRIPAQDSKNLWKGK